MQYTPLSAMCALCALAMTACTTSRETIDEAAGRTMPAAYDALGAPRERPGAVMVEEDERTVPTPYGGTGARRVCSTVATDIARLTAVLGPDTEQPPAPTETAEEARERSVWDSGQDLLSRAPDAAQDAAVDAYYSAIVGLNPVRPVARFVQNSARIEAQARAQREMADRRRAYLRGLFDGFGCNRRVLEQTFIRYGLAEGE
ncbi:MAG: lipoprotein [Oceanicaulis sp. HLUCCA04]|nr:MAG: lipoprotein [Oceanicaulis sp. HLUCCA04]